MNRYSLILIGVVIILLLSPFVSATSYVSESRSATMKDTFLVSLGIENVPNITITKALSYYNWISMGFLFLIGSMSSKRMTRFFAILLPIFAALFVYFGWLTATNSVTEWGIIIMCVLLAVVVYMKGSLRENFGGGGPGSLIMNLVFYLIVLQSCVGIINATGLWDGNLAPTQSSDFAPNADLTQSVPTASNSGGMLEGVASAIGITADLFISSVKMLLSIVISIAAFSVTINTIYPFIGQTTLGAMMLVIIQLGIWFAYALFIINLFGRPTTDTIAF